MLAFSSTIIRFLCSTTSLISSNEALNSLKPRLIGSNTQYLRRKMATITLPSTTSIAVLYQAIEPPIINGVRKPKKPGGYQDSGADIAYVLQQNGINLLTPKAGPDPQEDEGWCFPDTEDGILAACNSGATHLWANTILFAAHPLQTSHILNKYVDKVYVIGQPPRLVEQYDDKNFVNELLRRADSFDMPKSWIVDSVDDPVLTQLSYPVVGKPIRGRGSHGVKLCRDQKELMDHLRYLLTESPQVMLEEYLSGKEGTITVMPPSRMSPNYWSMPIVMRFNHHDGIAPYNGTVAVTSNSKVVSSHELESIPAYKIVSRQCEEVAKLLKVTAPIRIDVRQYKDDETAHFALFDINMKPNMTGPGRIGREDQSSLTALAAESLGWSYADLLKKMLESAQSLEHLRAASLDAATNTSAK